MPSSPATRVSTRNKDKGKQPLVPPPATNGKGSPAASRGKKRNAAQRNEEEGEGKGEGEGEGEEEEDGGSRAERGQRLSPKRVERRAAGQVTTAQRLKFSQKLVQGNKITTAELLKRLKSLHEELAAMDQDLVDTTSLNTVSKELMQHNLLLNKDKGVKAYVACCLADILKLYAPDAPYTAQELKDIFQFFFRQIKNISSTNDIYYEQYYYLLENLSQVKSVVLVCDLPQADDLMSDIFKDFFELMGLNTPKNVEIFMADILVQMIEESASVPAEVTDLILAQFLPKQSKAKPAAYRLAVDVCNQTSDRLQRYVCQYFTDVLLNAGKELSADPSASDDDSRELEDLKTAHVLIKQINRSSPSLLLNVIPQIEEELKTEDLTVRSLATTTLGDMFAEQKGAVGPGLGAMFGGGHSHGVRSGIHPGSGSELAKRYPSAWKAWLGRSRDKIPSVRVLVLERFKKIWPNHPELTADLEEIVRQKLVDPDDKVRAATCSIFSEFDYETVLHHVDRDILLQVAERCKDKKSNVRAEALKGLARLFNSAFPEIESRDPGAIEHFAWIPGEILTALTTSDRELAVLVEATILEYILPLPTKPDNESAWVDRLLTVMQHINEKATQILLAITRVHNLPPIFEAFISSCEKYNGGIIDNDPEAVASRLKQVVQVLAQSFPDPAKAQEDLMKFAKMNENRLYKLLRICMDPQTDFKGLLKNYHECQRRLSESSSSIVATFETFIRRSCPLIANRSSIPTLVKRIQKAGSGDSNGSNSDGAATGAKTLLDYMARGRPAMFKSHVAELVKGLAEEENEVLVETCLHALARLAVWDPTVISKDRKTLERLRQYALQGTPLQSKYAATVIASDKSNEDRCIQLVEEISESLPEAEGPRLVGHLFALNRIAKRNPDAFETKSDVITAFILKSVLITPDTEEEEDDANRQWVTDNDLPDFTRARLVAIRVLTNRCVAYASSESAAEASAPVFKLLRSLLSIDSENQKIVHSQSVAARLRLASALSLLKLASVDSFEEQVSKEFENLALTSQDPCFEVRHAFLTKTINYLHTRRLQKAKYNLILFLVAHDPEADLVENAKSSIIQRARAMPPARRVAELDMIFLRFIHLLAHHPDFTREAEDVKAFARYFEFYLDCVANAENISLLYHLATKIKTVRDSDTQGHSENMYTLSELAHVVIKARAKIHNWAITSYPNQVRMPADIFKALPSKEVQDQILRKTYLSAEIVELIGPVGRSVKVDSKPKEAKKRRKPSSKPKSTDVKPKKSRTPAKRRKKEWEASDDDEDDETSDEEADEPDGRARQSSAVQNDEDRTPKREGLRARAKGRPIAKKKAEELERAKSNDDEGTVGDDGGKDEKERDSDEVDMVIVRPVAKTGKGGTDKPDTKGKGRNGRKAAKGKVNGKAKADSDDAMEED